MDSSESSIRSAGLAPVQELATGAARIIRTRQRRRRLALALAVPCCAVAALLPIDALTDLPAGLRASLAGAALLAAGVIALTAIRPPGPRDPLAAAEAALGEHDRRLTAATQLRQDPDPRAQAQADILAATVPTPGAWSAPLRAGLPAARAWPFAALAGAAFLGLGLLGVGWPNLLAACGPRLWDPFGDHPPYSATRLRWVDPPSQAPYNETVPLIVAVDGPTPTDLVLHVIADGFPESAEAHLLPAGEGRWSVQLEPPIQPLRLWVAGAGTRTPWLELALDGIPRLRRSQVLLKAPDYANLPDTTVRCDGHGTPPVLTALAGSRLHLDLACSRVPAAVWVQLGTQPPERHAVDGTPQRTPGGDALAPLDLLDPQPGTWSVSLEGPDGARGTPLPVIAIERRTDELPSVRIVQPSQNGYATPGSSVPFVVQANDDLGLSRLTTYRLVNDKQISEDRHTLGGTGDTWRGSVLLDGVKPKDQVRLGAVARDTLPPDGQVSTPAEVTLTIIALDEYLVLVRDELDEQALMTRFAPVFAELGKLEEEARRLAEQPASPARDRKLAELDKQLADARTRFAEQAKLELFTGDGEVFKAVDERLAELQEQAKAGFPKGSGTDKAGALGEKIDNLTAEAESDAAQEWIADLAKAQRALATELADIQKSLATSDQARARLRAAAAQQRDLEQALTELQEHTAEVAARLKKSDPDQAGHLDQLAKDLGDTVPPAGNAAREAGRGKAEPAAGHASDAATRLEALVAKRRSGQGQGESEGKGGDKLGQCRAQMAMMAKRRMGQGGSLEGHGNNGALGMFGDGMYVRRGGKAHGPQGIPLYGPLATLAPMAGRGDGPNRAPNDKAVAEAAAGTEAATPYARAVRTTTAGLGASLTPAEEALVDEYYRRLADPAAAQTAQPVQSPKGK